MWKISSIGTFYSTLIIYKYFIKVHMKLKKTSLAQIFVQNPKYPVLNEQKRFYVLLCRFKISKTALQDVSILRWANGQILTNMT